MAYSRITKLSMGDGIFDEIEIWFGDVYPNDNIDSPLGSIYLKTSSPYPSLWFKYNEGITGWKLMSKQISGSTEERNSIINPLAGDMFFDTDLNKPVWYVRYPNIWVDASGSVI